MEKYLLSTPALDFTHPMVSGFAQKSAGTEKSPVSQAVNLYYAVRDGIRYDPYSIDLTVHGIRASTTLANGRGWCVAKAILLAACCRSLKIPARLGFADVRNHLSTERMRQQMKTDVFYWHGYTSIYLNEKWVKATPAFNIELCEKFNLRVLEFDGTTDSIYHPFDLSGHRHMEYLRDRGCYDDVPLHEIIDTFKRAYGMDESFETGGFDADVNRETGRA